MKNIIEKLGDALSEAVKPTPEEDQFAILDRKLIQVEPRADIPEATIKAVASRAESPFADEATIKAIKEKRAQWKHAWDAVIFHSSKQNAKQAWLDHQQKLGAKLSEGKTMETSDGWSRDDWESDFHGKMEAAKPVAEKFCAEAIEIAKEPVAKFIRFCNALADEIEGGERVLSQEFSVTYQPSKLVHAIRSAGNWARITLPSRGQWGSDPLRFMVFLDLE